MQAPTFSFRNILTGAALSLVCTLAPATWAQAQALPDDIPEHFYRAELVILERLVEPASIEEKMANRDVAPTVDAGQILWMDNESGNRTTDLDLIDTENLHLSSAVNRLKRSGNYRVLATAGWYEAFPPDHDTGPMKVALGQWLDGAQRREIEGYIRIDRQRYLHVGVHLNHWQDDEAALEEAQASTPTEPANASGSDNKPQDDTQDRTNQVAQAAASALAPAALPPVKPELLTWIRETRRMRSGEIHFIDSPTVGVLVYFEPIKQE